MNKNVFKLLLESTSFKLMTNFELPDWSKMEHVTALATVMFEYGIDRSIVEEGILRLIEGNDTGITDAGRKKRDSLGLKHVSFGYYSKSGKAPVTHKRKGNDFVKANQEEFEATAAQSSGETQAASAPNQTGTAQEPLQPVIDNKPLTPEKAKERAKQGSVAAILMAQSQEEKEKEEKEKKEINMTPEEKSAELLKTDHKTTDEQLHMTKTKAREQAKMSTSSTIGVGAGTPESRAGEAMVHKGIRMLMGNRSIDYIKEHLDKIVNSDDHVLNSTSGKKWVESAVATLTQMNQTIGSENIKSVAWDTPEGREALGISKSLETSSDMFVKLKDGTNVGISLKKDGRVFLNNGGWAKQSELLLNSLKDDMDSESHDALSTAMSLDAYNEDLDTRFVKATDTVDVNSIKSSVTRLKNEPADEFKKLFGGQNGKRYVEVLDEPESLIRRIKMGTANGVDKKAYSKLLQMYHTDEYNHLREADGGLTRRAFDTLNTFPSAKKGMNKHIIKSMHIIETLGLSDKLKSGGIDKFVTFYGIKPSGAALDENTLVTLFGSKFKEQLVENINEVRNGNQSVSDLEDFIVKRIEIDYDSGEILFKHESNKKFPLFTLTGRTRGIGEAPTMELSQTTFMAHALKHGTFNLDDWPEGAVSQFESDIR